MTNITYTKEIKIIMPYFKIPLSDFDKLVKLHGGLQQTHAHLANLFDNRKAIKN